LQVQNYPQAVAARTWIGKRYDSDPEGKKLRAAGAIHFNSSSLALAGAAEKRYTQLPALFQSTMPKLLVWGEDDPFQTVDYAGESGKRCWFGSSRPAMMENDPKAVAGALAECFAAER
jgi:hypothetical protein